MSRTIFRKHKAGLCFSWLACAALVTTLLLSAPGEARAASGDMTLCSQSNGEIMANDDCLYPAVSEDGRYVAFESDATNLVSGVTPGRRHIYRRDLLYGSTVLCSRSVTGIEGNGDSKYCGISADGSYVVFESQATNLIDGETTLHKQIFRKDLRTNAVRVASSTPGWLEGNADCLYPSMSDDGRYVSFHSAATNLVSGASTVNWRVYRKDLTSRAVTLCSASSTGIQGNYGSYYSNISADGRFVAFRSSATNLIDGEATSGEQVFRKDLENGKALLCSADEGGSEGNNDSYYPAISANGRYVAFTSGASDLVPGGTTPARLHVFRKDLQTGTVRLCSCTSGGVEGNNNCTNMTSPSISADGQYVAFATLATNLSSDANTGRQNILRKDVSTGTVTCCSVSGDGVKANHNSYMGDMTPDGRKVAFHTDATNLMDGTVTSHRQVLMKGLTSYTAFNFAEGCTGDNFQEYLCLGNSLPEEIIVVCTYLFSGAPGEVRLYQVPAGSRMTVDVNSAVGEGRDVSIRLTCERFFVAERPMYFAYGGAWTGGHDVVGAPWPTTSWYFAEGYTGPGFDQWVCVLNPGVTDAGLTFRFQTQEEGAVTRTGYVVPAGSRATFKVNDVLGDGYQDSLLLQSDQPVVAERPIYFDYLGTTGSRHWTGGHCVMGANCLKRDYFFAEGYTGSGFEEWLTLQNPNTSPVRVNATYQFSDGSAPFDTYYEVGAGTRRTVYVPGEVGTDREVSVYLHSDSTFMAERPMYFRYSGTAGHAWTGGHCVIGPSQPESYFYFAEGYTGEGFEEWLCIQNPSTVNTRVQITYYVQDLGPLDVREVVIPAGSRVTVNVNEDAGEGYQLSCRVEDLWGTRIVVERPMYFNYGGWTGGHDVVGYTP